MPDYNARARDLLDDLNYEKIGAWEARLAAALTEAHEAGRREMRDDARSVCFMESTACAAPIHCGCREKIAARIAALAEKRHE